MAIKQLLAPTEDFIKVERSKLAADIAAGSSITLTLENNDNFSDNDYVVIGREGSEKAELRQINAVVAGVTDIQVDTVGRAHLKGEPVIKYRYNQRKFYGSLTETGTFTELTSDGSPKDIQVDDPMGTLFEYTTGEGYLFFKSTYYNSEEGRETDADEATVVEADESKRYASIYQVRRKAGLVGQQFISDGDVEDLRKRAENEIDSAIAAKYSLPLSEVPALVENICALLAAGYFDYQEFGAEGEGKKWLGEARSILTGLSKGKRLLIGSDGAELSRITKVQRLDGYPGDSIETGAVDDRKFTLGMKY